MYFEWDRNKSIGNKNKHGIDFPTVKGLWNDTNRVEIETSYPLEDRNIVTIQVDF